VLCAGLGSAALVEGSAEDPARRSKIVAQVGPNATITVGALEDRIATMPGFQRRALGPVEALPSKLLSDILVPEVLVSLGAAAEGLERRPAVSNVLDRARSMAAIRALRGQLGPPEAIPMSEVAAYFDEHRTMFDAPERYQIWRILCATREEAKAVLDQATNDPTPKNFETLAREHSTDKATYLRSGNVGFVAQDGTSNDPALRVDPAIVAAARGVSDGSLVSDPVPEGDAFAVVWRRGTLRPPKRTVDEAAPQIRDTLWKLHLKTQTDSLLAALRAAKVRDVNEGLLDTL
jgi:peptidyl-prolyl cis-trans isomerase C